MVGDKDDCDSVEAHLRAKEEAKETRLYNRRMRELELGTRLNVVAF
jgi:hypothetical protein